VLGGFILGSTCAGLFLWLHQKLLSKKI